MNIKKTIVASLLACMLPAVVMAKDVSIGVSMALFDDNFPDDPAYLDARDEKDGVKSQIEDARMSPSSCSRYRTLSAGWTPSSTRWIPTR